MARGNVKFFWWAFGLLVSLAPTESAYAQDIELESYGGAADNGTTDNAPAWDAAIASAMVQCKNIHFRKGVYYFSRGITEDFSANSSATACIPYLSGEGLMGTYLAFGNGNFDGLSVVGSLTASNGYSLSGFTVIKGGYAGNPYGDGQGSGLLLRNLPRSSVSNVRAMQWGIGFYGLDVQEMSLINFESEFNYFGMKATYQSVSSPNNITCVNCRIGNNFNNGADIINASAFNWVGGSIESNGPQGHTIYPAQQWGIRFLYTASNPIEGASSATFTSCYIENNESPLYADIFYSNGYGNGTLSLNGCTFQRHAQYSKNNILFQTAGGFKQALVLSGNGFFNGLDYAASSSRPYVEVVSATDPVKIVDIGNVYSNPVEVPAFAAKPVIYGCGTGASISGTQYAGFITEGSAAGGCSLTFGQPFSQNPSVLMVSPDGIEFTYTASPTGVIVNNVGNLSGKRIYYYIRDTLN